MRPRGNGNFTATTRSYLIAKTDMGHTHGVSFERQIRFQIEQTLEQLFPLLRAFSLFAFT